MVCELLGKQPSAQVIHHFYRECWVLVIKVSFFHLLKYICEYIIHKERNCCRTVCLAKLLVTFDLVKSISQIDNELTQEPKRILAEIVFELNQKPSQNIINNSCISLSIQLMLFFFLMFLPVILDSFQILCVFLT